MLGLRPITAVLENLVMCNFFFKKEIMLSSLALCDLEITAQAL
jgi:hypothetical protein